MEATILDLRYRMKDVLRAIDRGESVTVLYRGKKKARLVPVSKDRKPSKASAHPACGIWADRDEMADPAAYVRKIRRPRFADLHKNR
jgi:antitoxin (DNA-binding transcriptional repressor) of toxin-antitoxin stability system